MALYKRGDTWWVRFTTPHGKRIRQSTGTSDRRLAEELHDRLKAEAWRAGQLGDLPERTWNDAAEAWLAETAHKADHEQDAAKLKWINRRFDGKPLRQIDREAIQRLGQEKAREASAATANRYLALFRAILRRAANEWGWLETAPRVRLYKEPKRRIRWLTRQQADRLLQELPAHQAAVAQFALATGLRKANVLGLQWSQVDMTRRVAWIHPDQAKARRAIPVPLNEEARAVLKACIGKHPEYVFTYQDEPIREVNTAAWRKALRRAGISDFRWHDLRHTWASWHVQAGTPLHALQELGGWESVEMVRRYAHLAPEHLAPHAERIVLRHKSGTAGKEKGSEHALTA